MTELQSAADSQLSASVRIVLTMLPQDGRRPSPEQLDTVCAAVHAMQTSMGVTVDPYELRRHVEARVAVHQADSTALVSHEGHEEWLTEARASRSWTFWDRYKRYQEDVKNLPPEVVRQLDRTTWNILGLLEDPARPGTWRRTGLVVGQVQSGKTGNYVGLACKAADAGYKLIVILAGSHNSLRSQTQLRVDEGLLGFDTQHQQRSDEDRGEYRIGAGAIAGADRPAIASRTTSAEGGDFKRAVAGNTGLPLREFPVVLVIKKHTGILNHLRRWITEVEGVMLDNGRRIVWDFPILVIDDEADYASIDTSKEEETDPSKVNGAIRDLLASCQKAAYVGYTATPFANIYIDHEVEHELYGKDLFPSAFIESLRAPSNYFGPDRIFGVDDSQNGDAPQEPLPVLRPLDDYTSWMPDKHRKDWVPPKALPPSLQEAIDSFILTCASRRARGQRTVHNSMLVHVTRFQDVQALVRDDVADRVTLIRDSLGDVHGSAYPATVSRLRSLWERDYAATTEQFEASAAQRLGWPEVEAELSAAADRIQVRAINGSSKDALTYWEHRRTGLSVIAIGGDKLSRGLTLEELSVSYYLRASSTYDTLLQMGRWFGYRPQYEDLCRLYTTEDLLDKYAEIAFADAELRRQFDAMAALELTPIEFGLRIRESQLKLGITAANKMRRSRRIRLGFSGDITETVAFSLAPGTLRSNYANLEAFVGRLAPSPRVDEPSRSRVWTNVTPDEVVKDFLDSYRSLASSWRVQPQMIAAYIEEAAAANELSSWTIRLVGSATGTERPVAGYDLGLVRRARRKSATRPNVYSTRRLVSPADEITDLTAQQVKAALDGSPQVKRQLEDGTYELVDPSSPSGPALRAQRAPENALLLLYVLENPLWDTDEDPDSELPPVVGFAISFPKSDDPKSVEYRVNQIWSDQVLGDLFDEDPE